MKAPVKLALFGIALVVAFAASYALGTYVEAMRTASAHDSRDSASGSADKRADHVPKVPIKKSSIVLGTAGAEPPLHP